MMCQYSLRLLNYLSVILKWALLLVIILLLSGNLSLSQAQKLLGGSHGDKLLMPMSCRSCHKGMSMALSGEESSCLPCHSGEAARFNMVQSGHLKLENGALLADIEAELLKPYRHPVSDVNGVHRRNEHLPEDLVNAARHSECVDCHNPHLAEKDRPFKGLKGKRVGNLMVHITEEYELCYRCHSESMNLPGESSNKHAEFKVSNPSFHPVEGEGKNTLVVSLKEPYVTRKEKESDVSIISCRDCHGSDNPAGPTGPHGSNYQGLLKYNYEMGDGVPESEFAYALCYKCHNRTSILNNESFPYHSQHIQGKIAGQGGTSCFTCHDAHGSEQYQNLIRFNEEVVSENEDGDLRYEARGYSAQGGACYLSCHGVQHNPQIEGYPGEY